MTNDIDTLTVRAAAQEEVHADRADLLVTIRGASLVTGSAALSKAREVRQLVSDLAAVGVPERDITLRSVTAETSSSVIGRSSSATYQLRVRCARLDDLAEVLGVITNQKNTQLSGMTWGYPDLAPVQDRLLAQSLARAAAKARLMAEALASELAGVHTVSETIADAEEGATYAPRAFAPQDASRARMTAEDLGLAVSHSKRLTAQVEVVYRVRPAPPSEAAGR